MQETTQRHFLMWQVFLQEEWNKPSKDNYYQMQTACEIRRANVAKGTKVVIEDMKLPFSTRTVSTPSQQSPQASSSVSQQNRSRYVDENTSSNEEQVTEKPQLSKQGLTKEQVSAISKARWLGMMTMPVVQKVK